MINTFSNFLEFFIDIEWGRHPESEVYKKIFLNEGNLDDNVVKFVSTKISELNDDDQVLKLALILKRYDFLEKSKKNRFFNENKNEITRLFFQAYVLEEYIWSVNKFLINFNLLNSKDFLYEYYLEHTQNLGSALGLLDIEFISNAKIKNTLLDQVIDLALNKILIIKNQSELQDLEQIYVICEKMQLQDRKKQVAQKIVDYLLACASSEQGVRRNFFVECALKYVNDYGNDRYQKRKELLNLVLKNTNNVQAYFDENTHSHSFEFDNHEFEKILDYFKNVGVHQSFYELASKLFNLYDYEIEKVKERSLFLNLATTIAYDSSGLPLYIVKNDGGDDVFFHEKTKDIQLLGFLFSKYIKFIRENSDFEQYIAEFHLPSNLIYIRSLGLLEDYKNNNFYGFFSQMIPIIENHFRYCLGLVDEPYITPNGIGGYDYLPMKAFLDSPVIREKLGINSIYILKLIFDDRRGLNYRNKLAHGILNPESVTEVEANFVFLTLIYMSYFEQNLIT